MVVQANRYLLLLVAAAVLAAGKGDDSEQCGVYIAESSTDHVLGSFAGKSYQRDELIGSSDAIVQAFDLRYHNRNEDEQFTAMLITFLERVGRRILMGGQPRQRSSAGHVGMINAVIYQPATLLKSDTDLLSSGYDESTSPGRGAFTLHHNLTLIAVDKITAGSEIFLDFGSEYNGYEDVTKANIDDYRKMDEAIEKIEAADEVYQFMKNDVLDLTAEARAPAARSLLPSTYHGLQEIMDKGGSALNTYPSVVKDVDWLKNNAYCQDNLVVGVSEIEHAGRGAFAKREMKKGEVVAPMPLVALNYGRKALTMTEYLNEHGQEVDSDEDAATTTVKTQQMLNYMLEHPQSSVLFFPAGPLVPYVNHGGKDANVKMIWSTKPWSNVKNAQKLEVESLSGVGAVDMIVELVATRGVIGLWREWAKAWKKHTDEWKKKMKKVTLKSAMVLNENHHSTEKAAPFPAPSEDDSDFGNENVALQCLLLYDVDKVERRRNEDGTRTKVYPWIPHPANANRLKTDSAIRSINRGGCRIVERSGDEASGYRYVVQPESNPDILVKNVPHSAIRFVDLPYRSPHHDETAFRHAIGFPDAIFPAAWKDLPGGYKDRDEL
ncbi:hypothetical protein QTG54_004256 [Skeletonema marinoi]|uniref:SET domain-containing protein n=1 Tax=Skeletonema marinoi TaxID=267567 RepID=A0AAD8YH26_9STRA|nr:hypothetical protein QTG54_004256 [Skeletonema marinoi]